MVMSLALPMTAAEQLDLIDNIVAERTQQPNKTFFNSIAEEWRQRVGDYLAHGGSPAHIPEWPAIMTKATSFKTLYSHPADGSAQGVMLQALREHELDICPSCGSPAVTETLDHYLPKGKYPHFAVTPANLTPMCDPCQRRKGESTGDATTPRFFIHPYFDTFSLAQIVQLTINAPFATPTFTLAPHPGLQAPETQLVSTHLRELQIARRFIRFFRNEHRRLLRNVTKMRVKGLNVADNIEAWQDGYADPTPNSWQHLFYDAVTRNVGYLAHIAGGPLPVLP
ncbi:HNH endonuclease [Rhizobium tumorigenes]|uniref:HNH endonuclease n=1 Tax=Rhizobium tumorigenes TaxID=2041385 RepID=A0AAF1K4U0_9HYPH|nr:HNH endonuclease [Rhizobium tumorigenes]WFR95705.1 HNH endonuclease [Rhizobium tumorigenes]